VRLCLGLGFQGTTGNLPDEIINLDFNRPTIVLLLIVIAFLMGGCFKPSALIIIFIPLNAGGE
jgi:hypothetical protein